MAVAVVDVLLLDPVRPARLLAMLTADVPSREDLPTEALVAPPLVSHGFGGDGEDIFPREPPHRALVRLQLEWQSLRS
jgi:hypothetical protein